MSQPNLRRLPRHENAARTSSILPGVTGEKLRALEENAFPSSVILSLTAEQVCSRKMPSVPDTPRDHKLESVKEVLKKFVEEGVPLPRTEKSRNHLINQTLEQLRYPEVSAATIRRALKEILGQRGRGLIGVDDAKFLFVPERISLQKRQVVDSKVSRRAEVFDQLVTHVTVDHVSVAGKGAQQSALLKIDTHPI